MSSEPASGRPTSWSRLRRFEVAAMLDALADDFPSCLVPPARREAMAAFTRGMPPVFSWAVLEAQLFPAKPEKLDLLASIVDQGDGRGGIAQAYATSPGHPGLVRAGLLAPWLRGALADAHAIWMEWDAPFDRPEPLQLVAIDPTFLGASALSADAQVALAAEAFAASFGSAHDARVLLQLRRAIDALPRGGQALYAANLKPRGLDVERLFVGLPWMVPPMSWLQAIDWPGDRAWAAEWIGRMYRAWTPSFFQVELDANGVHPYLGLELCQTDGRRHEHHERFLRGLVGDGLATRDAIDALVRWNGRRALDDGRVEVRTFHLKVIRDSAGAFCIKAYLGVRYEVSG